MPSYDYNQLNDITDKINEEDDINEKEEYQDKKIRVYYDKDRTKETSEKKEEDEDNKKDNNLVLEKEVGNKTTNGKDTSINGVEVKSDKIKVVVPKLKVKDIHNPTKEEKELIKALNEGEIAGCALDVYEFEPKISEELKQAKNIVLAPHLGNATFEARLEMGNAAADNIEDYVAGKEPRNNVAK